MIGSLRGHVIDRSTRGEVLVEVGGVGYRVVVPPSSLARVPPGSGEVFLHVHHHVREDNQTLYGFLGRDERDCFEALIGAHGVGPTLALAILSVHGPGELVRVLAEEDVAALCLVPGVGKKTAARLLVELKARLDIEPFAGAATGPGAGSANGVVPGAAGSARAVVRQALAELGYGPDEVRTALDGLPDDGAENDLLRRALQRLAGAR